MMTREHLPSSSFVGWTPKEASRYSLGELIDAAARSDVAKLGYYRECSREVARRTGQLESTGSSFFVPGEYLTRDLQTTGTGGALVSNPVNFASGLFGASLIGALPMRRLPLDGGGTLATVASTSTAWLAGEAGETNTNDPTFGQVGITAKTISTTTNISRHMNVLGGPGARAFVEQQLGEKLAESVGVALVDGTGAAGQPWGLLRIPGPLAVSGSSLAWLGVRDLIERAEGYTAGGLQFLAGVGAAKVLRAREKATGSGMVLADGKIDGVPALVTRCMPSDALLLAPWTTIVMATWGALEVTVTPLAAPGVFRTGAIGVRLMWSVDFAAELPTAIGRAVSIT